MYKILNPKEIIKGSYNRIKPYRVEFDNFKKEISTLYYKINENEREDHNKILLRDFFINTFYKNYFVNSKGDTDLAIHLGKSTESKVGVLLEVKRPSKTSEMISKNNLNAKAMHEVILYYLRERIEEENDDIKNIVITNIYEWFVFDAQLFEKLFFQNSELVKNYKSWRDSLKVSSNTSHFYNEIAKKFLVNLQKEIAFIHFDLRDYQKSFNVKKDESKLIQIFKLLSPNILLKESFSNDSNNLDKQFYYELLHIIGLEEIKEGSKKVIKRKNVEHRDNGSLLENTIKILKTKSSLDNIKNKINFGESEDQQLFNLALELNITWINRILFLKLLEAQLVNYHKENENYKFLNSKDITDYDELSELFHEVLAQKKEDRKGVKQRFENIPYLNSSLFEISDLERKTFSVDSLKDRYKLPIYKQSILKKTNKNYPNEIPTLEYLFKFLDAYDFASETSDEITEEKKSIINASVLGLIFEKINGYKEGSFFTPGFITMYMARQTIRRAVLQKFEDVKDWKCKTIEELRDKIEYTEKEARIEANQIINSIKICDPAVGSGHFLVSSLNEILAVKSELNILNYLSGNRIKDYKLKVENDELSITDEDENLFNYYLNEKGNVIEGLQKLQETLFHEKEIIIENCLFGVDINPNSVNICRLRLWIELLKNSYYTKESNYKELETLPNIDINIKQGNSLVSRFDLKEDIFRIKDRGYFEVYKINVQLYKNATNKEERNNLKKAINDVKEKLKGIYVDPLNEDRKKIKKLRAQFFDISNQLSSENDEAAEKILKKYDLQIEKLSEKIIKKEEEDEVIYKNAFEWRFEFPEVLDDNGNFMGFDVVIGNPPYINFANLDEIERHYYKMKYTVYKNKSDLYAFFIELMTKIKRSKLGFSSVIVPHTWITTSSFQILRKHIFGEWNINDIVELDFTVFKDAYVKTTILISDISEKENLTILNKYFSIKNIIPKNIIYNDVELKVNFDWNSNKQKVIYRIFNNSISLGEIIHFTRGIKTSDDNRFLSGTKVNTEYKKVIRGKNIKNYSISFEQEYIWYRPDLMKEKIGSLPHSFELFEQEIKIITQRVNSSGKLFAALDDQQFYTLDTTNVSSQQFDKRFSIFFICALLNSKVINWWFNDQFKMPTISGYELHQIPVPSINEDNEFVNQIEEQVLNIVNIKKSNPKSDTSKLEKEIDQLIYKLYGLTEEEIKIVEESVN